MESMIKRGGTGSIFHGSIRADLGRVEDNVESVSEYFSSKRLFFRNDHILIRLLSKPDLVPDLDDFVRLHEKNMMDRSRVMGLTSLVNKGRPLRKPMIGKDTPNTLAVTTSLIMDHDGKDLKDIMPLRYVHHNYTNMVPVPCDGTHKVDADELYRVTAFELDITALLVAYHRYAVLQSVLSEDIDNKRFILEVLVSGTMRSFANIALINRSYRLLSGELLDEDTYKYPFFQYRGFGGMDDYLKNKLPKLIRNTRLKDMIYALPVLEGDDIMDVLEGSPGRTDITNIRTWIYWCRIIWMGKMVNISSDRSLRASIPDIRRITYLLKRTLNNKDYLNFIEGEVLASYQDAIMDLSLSLDNY